jgi:hypothetical protein
MTQAGHQSASVNIGQHRPNVGHFPFSEFYGQGSRSCTSYPAGSYSEFEGSAVRTKCPAGMFHVTGSKGTTVPVQAKAMSGDAYVARQTPDQS